MKYILAALLILCPLTSLGADARFSNGILEIDEVDVPFSPNVVHNAKLSLAEDGRWDLLEYSSGKETDNAISFGYEGGPCLSGYCSFPQLVITPSSISISHHSPVIGSDGVLIPSPRLGITMHQSNGQDLWDSIIKLEEFKSFSKLPDVIGDCLGCTDSPVAYIAIQSEGHVKQVRFEPQNGPAQLYGRLSEIYDEQSASLRLAMKQLGY